MAIMTMSASNNNTFQRELLTTNMPAIHVHRQHAADLLKRLHISEVELERKRRNDWEAALSSWRRLRTHHAISLFNATLCSSQYAEPPARLAIFADIHATQHEAAEKLTAHIRTLPSVLPPHMTEEAAAAWREGAEKLLGEWAAVIEGRLQALRVQDDALEQQVWGCHHDAISTLHRTQ